MIIITRIIKTCIACPTQWDAWDIEGSYYYIRFRFGKLTVHKGENLKELIFSKLMGGEYDGEIDLGRVARATKEIMKFEL